MLKFVREEKLVKAEKLLKNNPEELNFLLMVFVKKNAIKRSLDLVMKYDKTLSDFPNIVQAMDINSVHYLIKNFPPNIVELRIRSFRKLILIAIEKHFENSKNQDITQNHSTLLSD